MKSRRIIQSLALLLVFSGSLFVLGSVSRNSEDPATSCEESMEDCSRETRQGKMIWEGLADQFYSAH